MKKLVTIFTLVGSLISQSHSQISFGLRVGMSPKISPGTSHLVVNRNNPANESLFNLQDVSYTGQIGLLIRRDGQHFWFMAEVLYGKSTTRYSMRSTSEIGDPTLYREKRSFIDIPCTAGVTIGKVEIFSGFNVTKDLQIESELAKLNGFNMALPTATMGWHSGVGVNLGNILIDLRYQQQFCNYGQGRFLNGEELLLKNAPGRVIASAAFRI